MLNAFISTAFWKHLAEIVYEYNRDKSPKLFYYLLSTTDRKEKINQYLGNVSVNPIDCVCENFKNYSPNGEDFNPSNLNLPLNNEKRLTAASDMYDFFKHQLRYQMLISYKMQIFFEIGRSQKSYDENKF